MTKAKCFNCEKELVNISTPILIQMEELIKARLPVFCGVGCAEQFPPFNSTLFNIKLTQLKRKYNDTK